LSKYWQGVITGALVVLVVFGVIFTLKYFNKRDKEILEYAEKQMEIETLREDYRNRDPVEFIDDIPDVRRAADGAAADFERKRDEALQRFRSRNVDKRDFRGGTGSD
jgi:hypothetical protein